MTVPALLDRVFAAVIGHEGGYTTAVADPGNWTGGRCGVGECRGTNWGISAAAYPTLNIAALTQDQAKAIFQRDYWNRVRGDELPPGLALLVVDAAYNNGVDRAARWLQQAAGVAKDGALGPRTLAAVRAADPLALGAEFMALRTAFMAGLPGWRTFGLGWSRRLARLPYQAMALAGPGGLLAQSG